MIKMKMCCIVKIPKNFNMEAAFLEKETTSKNQDKLNPP